MPDDVYTLTMGRKTTGLVFRALRKAALRKHGTEQQVLISLCVKMKEWLEHPPPKRIEVIVLESKPNEPNKVG